MLREHRGARHPLAHHRVGLQPEEGDPIRDAALGREPPGGLEQRAVADHLEPPGRELGRDPGEGLDRRQRRLLRDHPPHRKDQVGVLRRRDEQPTVHAARDHVAVGVADALCGEVVEQRLRHRDVAGEPRDRRLVGQHPQRRGQPLGRVEAPEVDEGRDAQRLPDRREARPQVAELGEDREGPGLAQERLDPPAHLAERHARRAIDEGVARLAELELQPGCDARRTARDV